MDNHYYNELAVEYSYFGIEEAIALIKSFNFPYSEVILKAIASIQILISEIFNNGKCDLLGSRYLQNLVYQMVRDSHRNLTMFLYLLSLGST